MERKSAYYRLYKEISAIDKEALEDRKWRAPDLFSKNDKSKLLTFLQPKSLINFIRPVPSQSTSPIEILKINTDPKTIFYKYLDSSYGNLLIASTDLGICYVSFASDKDLSELQQYFPDSNIEEHKTDFHKTAMDYIENKAVDSLALHIKGTDFQLQVWEQLCKIPKGQVSTYKYIAIAIDKPKASIAVGAAVGKNAIALLIPCHRVIRSNGIWQGFRWGNKRKATLLSYELLQYKNFSEHLK